MVNGQPPYPLNELQRRDALLSGVAEAARRLLAIANFDTAVNAALEAIAIPSGLDRIYIDEFQVDPTSGREIMTCPYEWTAPNIIRCSEIPDHFPMDLAAFGDWATQLKAGKPIQGLAKDLSDSAQDLQNQDDALSLLAVPILLEGKLWGCFGFDDCTTERVWSDAEITVLETAAACIGSAIERDLNQKQKEATAQARAAELEAHNRVLEGRDRILEATATASNILLSDGDFDEAVSSALQILGKSVGCDRAFVAQQFDDHAGETLGFLRILYEWNSPGISSQTTDHIGLQDIGWQEWGIEDWYHRNLKGEAFGQTTDDFPERFQQLQQEVSTQSVHNIPIFVTGRFWGVVGTDHCREQRLLTTAELAVFKTAASCIGNAIEREQIRAARAAAERNILIEREQAAQDRAAQLKASNTTLSLRERWLNATAAAANELLSADDLETAIYPTLQTIGESIGVDRIGILQVIERDGQKFLKVSGEWVSPGQPMQSEHEDLEEIPIDDISELLAPLSNGQWTGGDIEDYSEPFRSGQKSIGVQSTYSVPIMIDGQFWGIIGIDHCREKKLLTSTEIAVFQTIASCFGSAIQRDQSRKAREAAERTILIQRERAARADELEAANQILSTRDRWLETTAIAANQLLSSEDVTVSVNRALQTIGENLGCDRITILCHINDDTPDSLGLMRLLYEWDAPGISAQIDNPDLRDIPSEGIENWFRQIMAGQWIGGIVDELEEPFRSGQQQLGVKSTYAMPVFVADQFWGIVAMDHCHEARHLSPAEVAVFKTAATCVGSALYQDTARRDRAAQERALLLGRVAESANLLLRSTDYTTVLPEVVKLLGEAVKCDRLGIGQDLIPPPGDKPTVRIRPEWEWCSTDTLPSTVFSPSQDQCFFWEDAPYIAEKLSKGQVVNSRIADLPEPDRNLMAAQGNKAELYVPIWVDLRFWGFISFDNCSEPRLFDDAEIAILQIAAESIAAAIARQA